MSKIQQFKYKIKALTKMDFFTVDQSIVLGLMSNGKLITKISEKKAYFKIEIENIESVYFYSIQLLDYANLSERELEAAWEADKKVIDQMVSIGQKINTWRVIKYSQVYISYPYVCLFHQPFRCNLMELLQQKKEGFSYSERLELWSQLAQIVKQIQDHSIVHRKMNPLNILVLSKAGEKPKLMLGDFSSAQVGPKMENVPFQESKQLTKFLAPELQRNENSGFSSDIWSLGVLFYYVLFENLEGVAVKNNEVLLAFPGKHLEWIEKFLEGILRFDPKQRTSLKDIMLMLKSAKMCKSFTEKSFEKPVRAVEQK